MQNLYIYKEELKRLINEKFCYTLDKLIYTNSNKSKIKLLVSYMQNISDPDRGYAIAAICNELNFVFLKPSFLKELIIGES